MLIGGVVLMLKLILGRLFLNDAYRGGFNDAYLPGIGVCRPFRFARKKVLTLFFAAPAPLCFFRVSEIVGPFVFSISVFLNRLQFRFFKT